MALGRERMAELERWSWDLAGGVSNDVAPADRLEMQELVKAGSEAANLQFHADMLKAEVARLTAALAAAVAAQQRAEGERDEAQRELAALAMWSHPQTAREVIGLSPGRIATLQAALKKAHACPTLRDDGTCEGCFVSEALQEVAVPTVEGEGGGDGTP